MVSRIAVLTSDLTSKAIPVFPFLVTGRYKKHTSSYKEKYYLS